MTRHRRVALRTQLLALALAVAVPLLILNAFHLATAGAKDVSDARGSTLALARYAAAAADQILVDTRSLLDRTAQRPHVRAMRADDCDPILLMMPELYPGLTNATLVDRTGTVICSARGVSGRPMQGAAGLPWFEEALASGGFVVGPPQVGDITGRWLSTLAMPVRDDRGEIVGVVTSPVDLERFQSLLTGLTLLDGTMLAVVDQGGTMMARSLDPGRWVGEDARWSEVVRAGLESGEGVVRAPGVDGVDRIYGYATVPTSGWIVYAGVPVDVALAAAKDRVRQSVVVSLVMVALVAGLVVTLGRSITRPVRQVARVADAISRGDAAGSVPVQGPVEVAEVADRFNQMVRVRREAEEALRLSEERLRLAIDAGGQSILDWSIATDCLTVLTPRPCRQTGDCDGIWEGTSTDLVASVHEDDRAALGAALQAAADGVCDDPSVEYRVLAEPTDRSWRMLRGRVFRDAAGRPVRVVGLVTDVSERKQAEHQRTQIEREAKLRALGQLAGGVAHDLNQSLAIIAGYGELAERALAGPLPDVVSAREQIGLIGQAALDGGDTVRRLLTFARAQPDAPPVRVEVGSLLREVERLTAPRWQDVAQAEGRCITIEIDVEPGLAVQGWASALREALINLVLNAVDALPAGGTIALGGRARADQVEIEVTDTGIGMPATVQEQAFEPFFTTKGDRGTGLGLSQVFGIVERHGGRIDVRSRPGKGTTFLLRLPRAVEVAQVAAVPPRTVGDRPLRILAVDDEATIVRLMTLLLSGQGHDVLTADSGEAALTQLRRERVDVVISDLGLGDGMNGWELAERVRTEWPQTRFILATGWGAGIDSREAALRGVQVVLSKPYRTDDLRRALADVMACAVA